jgi:hypothetical protein
MQRNGVWVALMGLIALALLYPAIRYNNTNRNIAKKKIKFDFENTCAS